MSDKILQDIFNIYNIEGKINKNNLKTVLNLFDIDITKIITKNKT